MDEAVHHFAENFLAAARRLEVGKACHPAVLAVPVAAKVGTAVEAVGSLMDAALGDAGEEIPAVAA